MDKNKIKERLVKLEEAKQQMLANLNAIAGGIQECNYWLSVIEAPVIEAPKDMENVKDPTKV
jgi:hypothetical protein